MRRTLFRLIASVALCLSATAGSAMATEDGRLFAAAIAAADMAAIDKLIAEGKDVDGAVPDKDGNDTRTTPLIVAVYLEQEAAARRLIEAGARTDLVDDENRSPLWYAVYRQDKALVELLGAQPGSKAVVNLPDKALKQTPLHVAVGLFDAGIVSYLQSIGASVESRNYMGRNVAEVCRVDGTEACAGLKL